MKRLIWFAFLIALICATFGCGSRQRTAVALIDDPTASAAEGHDQFRSDVRRILMSGALDGGQVCIIHACVKPHILYAGPVRRGKDMLAAFDRAAQSCPCVEEAQLRFCGTNVTESLAIAQIWLSKPEYRVYSRVVLGHTDLAADPCKATHRKFADPLRFKWDPGIAEIHLFGLSTNMVDKIRRAWGGMRPTPCIHLPHDSLEARHIELSAKAL
jgi:hypothetical protein